MSKLPKVLMIHEITPEILSLDKSVYDNFDILTFDDCLYTQYLNHKHFAKFNKKMIFFLSTNIICPENINQSEQIIYCGNAHKKAFKGNFENYMKLSQIQELSKYYEIGGHGHNHILFKNSVYSFDKIKEDTDIMVSKFKEYNLDLNSFCFPYNQDNTFYRIYIKKLNLQIFGDERIPIESYIKNTKSYKPELKYC